VYAENVTRRGVGNAAGFIAVALLLLAFLAPLSGQNAVALTASASALALLTAGFLRYAKVIVLADSAEAAHADAPAHSSSHYVIVLPQRDPDAAGKPRPRAPGSNPSTV